MKILMNQENALRISGAYTNHRTPIKISVCREYLLVSASVVAFPDRAPMLNDNSCFIHEE